jgi:hypothetical protein
MNWVTVYGTRFLAFITGVVGLITTQAGALAVSARLLAWLTFISSVATLASSVFFTSEKQTAAKFAMRAHP